MALAKTVTALLLSSTLALGSPRDKRQSCPPVQIMTGRGSDEAPGEGVTGEVVDAIVAANPGAGREAIDYPALFDPYDQSSSEGTAAVTEQLTAFVEDCPDSQVVLLGYSQGAHIIGDSLCGGGGVSGIGPETPPISTEIGDHVTAVVQFGDPRFIQGQSYNQGTADGEGIFPRLPRQSCEHYADSIQSYCDDGDPVCDQGDNDSVHLGYIDAYKEAMVDFVNSKLQT